MSIDNSSQMLFDEELKHYPIFTYNIRIEWVNTIYPYLQEDLPACTINIDVTGQWSCKRENLNNWNENKCNSNNCNKLLNYFIQQL